MTEFKASLDTLAKIITAVVFIILIVLANQSINALVAARGDTTTILIHTGGMVLMFLVFFGAWLYASQSYSISDTDLIINRPGGKVKISLSDIRQVRAIGDDEMTGTIRTFASGGLWGYYGKFYTPGFGHSTFYATQRINRVLVVTKQGKRIILTPDDITLIEKIKANKQY